MPPFSSARSETFFLAAGCGNLPLIQSLSQDPEVNLNYLGAYGLTPLNSACTQGRAEVVSYLLGLKGLDPNLADDTGSTPFWNACRNGKDAVVALLLAHDRIQLNKPRKDGSSPFYAACLAGHKSVVSKLLPCESIDVCMGREDGSTPFSVACSKGRHSLVSLLLADQRIDVTTPKDDGATPFLVACQEGHASVVALLLADPRVDVNQPRNDGATPFYMACQQSRRDLVALFSDGPTPRRSGSLMVMRKLGYRDVISLLLADPRVDINKPMDDETTPLWILCHYGHLLLVRQILDSGRSVSISSRLPWSQTTAAEQARITGSRMVNDLSEPEEVFVQRNQNCLLIADLLDKFKVSSALHNCSRHTRHQLAQ